MRRVLYAENGVGFLFIVFLYVYLDFSLMYFILLLLVPDVTMLGYLVNGKVGAVFYNMGHSLFIPIVLCGVALMSDISVLLMLALIWLAHIFMDRAIGYGLKYVNSFKETHMQRV